MILQVGPTYPQGRYPRETSCTQCQGLLSLVTLGNNPSGGILPASHPASPLSWRRGRRWSRNSGKDWFPCKLQCKYRPRALLPALCWALLNHVTLLSQSWTLGFSLSLPCPTLLHFAIFLTASLLSHILNFLLHEDKKLLHLSLLTFDLAIPDYLTSALYGTGESGLLAEPVACAG